MRSFQLCAVVSTISVGAVFASVPEGARVLSPVPTAFDAVVRVNNNGTGSVIDKHAILDDMGNITGYNLCVLTNDHVVKGVNQNFIGFGDMDSPDIAGTFNAFGVARAPNANWPQAPNRPAPPDAHPQKPDLAVIGVRVNLAGLAPQEQGRIHALQPFFMSHYGIENNGMEIPNAFPKTFSSIGYGRSGELVDEAPANGVFDGYAAFYDYGDKRYFNNSATAITNALFKPDTNPYFEPEGGDPRNNPKYVYEALEWDLTTGMAAVPGEGTAFGGDSGSPYLTELPVFSGSGIPVFTQVLIGVHAGGEYDQDVRLPDGTMYRYKRFGRMGYGVRLTPQYIDWIEQQCELLPEPSSLALVLVGAALLRRR